MKTATALSVGLHVAVLAWATLSYSGRAVEAPPPEALPVEFISAKEFTQITKGIKNAPQKEKPKALVEKKDAPKPKPVEQPKAKVAEKEVKAARDETPPPQPEEKPKPVEQKTEKAKPKPPPKVDEIGEKIKQQADDKQKEAKLKPDRLPPRRPPRPRQADRKFQPDKIAALLNKRDPKRQAETGELLSADPTLGSPLKNDKLLSASEIALLIAKIRGCWDLPAGNQETARVIIPITIHLRRDGMLQSNPSVDISVPDGRMRVIADSAIRAIIRCQPYTMFSQSKYAAWKNLPLGFDPSYMYEQ